MANQRSRDWCFTLNNYTEEEYDAIHTLDSTEYQYIVYGKEVGESGTHHLQGYVYFVNAKSMSAVKKMLGNRCHLEKTKGTPQQASDYCKKDNLYVESGKLPEKQGKRSDLEQIRNMVKEGKTMNDVIDVASNYQAIRTAELVLKYKETKRNWKPYVKWIWGESGSGKTRYAYDNYPNLYRKTNSSGKWWDGYDAHSDVLIDDVKDLTREYYSMLLELLDRYDARVETKGGSRQFLAKNIIITSILEPFVMYQNYGEAKELLRRIDSIVELNK